MWHTCVVAFVHQAEGGNFLKEIPVSDRSDTFMTLKKCLCGGEVETFFCSKSSSGSIAQSIKVPSLDPRRGEVRYVRLQLAVVDLRKYQIFTYAP